MYTQIPRNEYSDVEEMAVILKRLSEMLPIETREKIYERVKGMEDMAEAIFCKAG